MSRALDTASTAISQERHKISRSHPFCFKLGSAEVPPSALYSLCNPQPVAFNSPYFTLKLK